MTDMASTEPFIGQVLRERSFEALPERLGFYREGLALEASAAIPVPAMFANQADFGGRTLFSHQFGHLWLRQEWEFHRPMRTGVEYAASGRVVDIYERRDRTVILTETILTEPSGELCNIQRHHQSFLLTQGDGEVKFRDPGAKEGAREFAIPHGTELPPIERAISLEMCGLFFHGSSNYHTDLAESRNLGFRDVVVGGTMTMSYIGEVLERHFGSAWQQRGNLLVKFTNPVWAGETVRARAVVVEPGDDPSVATGVFAWVEKSDGTVVIAANGDLRP